MNRDYNFTVGQRVRTYDQDFNETVYGTVVDKTSECVMIKWDDLSKPSTHERHEFEDIHLTNKQP